MMNSSDLYRPPTCEPLPPTELARFARIEFGDDAPTWLLELAARRTVQSGDDRRLRVRNSLRQLAKRVASFLL